MASRRHFCYTRHMGNELFRSAINTPKEMLVKTGKGMVNPIIDTTKEALWNVVTAPWTIAKGAVRGLTRLALNTIRFPGPKL